MHRYDARTQRIADLVFAYMRERLALEPVPLDHGVEPDDLAARAPNLIGAAGNDPATVLQQYSDVLAPAAISSDSPRFLAFIPAAPTKADAIHDLAAAPQPDRAYAATADGLLVLQDKPGAVQDRTEERPAWPQVPFRASGRDGCPRVLVALRASGARVSQEARREK